MDERWNECEPRYEAKQVSARRQCSLDPIVAGVAGRKPCKSGGCNLVA